MQRKNGNKIEELFPENDPILQSYNKKNVYDMNIKYNLSSNEIFLYINEKEIFNIRDESFIGSNIGLVSSGNGTIFSQLLTR